MSRDEVNPDTELQAMRDCVEALAYIDHDPKAVRRVLSYLESRFNPPAPRTGPPSISYPPQFPDPYPPLRGRDA